MNLKSLILLFFIAFMPFANAQVSFTSKASKTTLGVNERLRIDFTMNQDGDHFIPPNFTGFTVVAGPNQAISNSWVNGKSSYRKTYSYFIQPTQTGEFLIGEAQITIDGKVYKTEPIEITISDAVASPNGNNLSSIVSENIHLVAIVSDRNPYLNQGVVVEYRLYVSPVISLNNRRLISYPSFSNFWSQNIRLKNPTVEKGDYKGKASRYLVLRKELLYPQKTGKTEIEPMKLMVSVDIPTEKFDMFGRRHYERTQETISTGSQTIDVKPLPTANKPASFTGAVGDFDFSISTTKNSLKAAESLQLKVQVSGKGNLKLFDLPALTVPNSLEMYEPEHSEDVSSNASGMNGKIVDSYTIVPSTKGKYPIPPMEFSYFDPESGTYKTLTSEEIMITVKGGPQIPVGNTIGNTPTDKQPVVAKDQFRYIKLDANLSPINKDYFFSSILFWCLLLIPLFLIPFVIIFGNKQKERANDIAGIRIKKADKLARKYLSDAKKNLGNQKDFYDALERALHNYLKAKLHLQTSEMSKEHIGEILHERGAKDELIQAFTDLLKSCEFARYTPTSSVTMQQDYQKAAKTISGLDKQIK